MPHSASKSQADKGGHGSSVRVTTPQTEDLKVEDIIPGRLTQNQWMDMLMYEEAEETVGEIMDELMSKVMEGCFKVYIERQLAPYSASWATSCLAQVVERQLLCRDEGEGPEEATKTEDSEPMPATPDSWAQGCVPIVYATPPSHSISKQADNINQAPEETEPRLLKHCHVMEEINNSPKLSVKDTSHTKPVGDRSYKGRTPCPPLKIDQKKKQQDMSPSKTVLGKLLPSKKNETKKRIQTKTKSRNLNGQ